MARAFCWGSGLDDVFVAGDEAFYSLLVGEVGVGVVAEGWSPVLVDGGDEPAGGVLGEAGFDGVADLAEFFEEVVGVVFDDEFLGDFEGDLEVAHFLEEVEALPFGIVGGRWTRTSIGSRIGIS